MGHVVVVFLLAECWVAICADGEAQMAGVGGGSGHIAARSRVGTQNCRKRNIEEDL